MRRGLRVTDEQVDALIGGVYDAAGEAARWEPAIQALCATFNSNSGVLWLRDEVAGDHPLMHGLGMDPHAIDLYQQYYHREDIWLHAAASLPAGGVTVGESLVPLRDLRRSAFHADILTPSDVEFVLCARVVRSAQWLGHVAVYRCTEAGEYSAEEFRLMQRLMPHLQRAVALHLRIARLDEAVATLGAAFDEVATGILVLDRRGVPLVVNRAARAVVERGDGLALTRAGLRCGSSDETATLRRLVGNAAMTAAGDGGQPAGAMPVTRGGGGRPYALWVAPLRGAARNRVGGRGAVIVFIGDPERDTATPADVLAGLYGLTPAEARLAEALARGATVAEHADAFGVTQATVRWHLKNVLAKTGTHGIADLVRLLLRDAPPLAPGPGGTDVPPAANR